MYLRCGFADVYTVPSIMVHDVIAAEFFYFSTAVTCFNVIADTNPVVRCPVTAPLGICHGTLHSHAYMHEHTIAGFVQNEWLSKVQSAQNMKVLPTTTECPEPAFPLVGFFCMLLPLPHLLVITW